MKSILLKRKIIESLYVSIIGINNNDIITFLSTKVPIQAFLNNSQEYIDKGYYFHGGMFLIISTKSLNVIVAIDELKDKESMDIYFDKEDVVIENN